MPLIRCTRKLLTEIGAVGASSAEQAHAALLGDWYANLLRIERRKCVIFTSEQTLLTFLVVGLDRAAIRDYATLFRTGLRQLLENEGYAPGDVDRVLDTYRELTLALTNDRSVLGSLNDMARMAEALVQYNGGLQRCDLGAINHELNLTPMSRLQMDSPQTTTRRVLGGGDLTAHAKGWPSPQRKILVVTNPTIAAQDRPAAERPYVAIEVPPGQPQIRYFAAGYQWVPRGGVVRCFVRDDERGKAVIHVDDQELSLEEFGDDVPGLVES